MDILRFRSYNGSNIVANEVDMALETPRLFRSFLLFALLFVLLSVSSASAATLNLSYEKVVYDSYGNELGYLVQRISSIQSLPSNSPWRAYLSQMVGTKSLLTYAQDIAGSLNSPLNLTISDRNSMSSSSKTSQGYNLNLYKHVTQYSTAASQKFVFLHEVGHVAMLNAYPYSYNFTNLNYGADNVHYIDEILPNANTSWVEGWANAFAAYKNDGKVFSLSLNSDPVVAFLKNNTFEEMTRNELFVAKVIYDIMVTLPSGKDKVFNVIARAGPHFSLKDFSRAYVSTYPQDQIALAKLINKNSQGKVSLDELLSYVNNGSRTVTRSFYDYLTQAGKLGGTPPTSTGSGSTSTTSSGSWWSSMGNFFSRIFGGIFGSRSSQPVAQTQPSTSPRPAVGGATGSDGIPWGEVLTTSSPQAQGEPGLSLLSSSADELAAAHDEYYRAFQAYNETCAKQSPDSEAGKKAMEHLRAAKASLKRIRGSMKAR